MNYFRRLDFLRDGDYFSYGNKIYKVNWSLKEPNNAVLLKTGVECYIEGNIRVKWLKNYKNVTVM